MLNILPKHTGQPYFTNEVITAMMGAKVSITDANQIDPTGSLGKAILTNIALPSEMEADRTALLAMFPQFIIPICNSLAPWS